MGANFNFNKVILGGRLTAEPELKQTQGGHSVVSFSVAVNRRTKPGEEQKSDFFNVTAWRQTADFVARYFHKGSSICIVGFLQNSSWQDQNGQKHYRTDIVADEVMFVDSKSEGGQASAAIPEYKATTPMPNFEEVKTDDDLPF
jgi:single-strand DNA-binding protein